MNRDEIDLILNKNNDEVVEAHKEIVDLQKGTGHIIYTGLSHLDYFLIGGLNNKMVFIGSRPSMGKTYHCESTINSLLDTAINPNQNISILRLNLEMQTRSLLLRDLKKSLNKKMRDIISSPYTPEEQEIVKKVVAKHRDPRIVNFSRIVEGDDLRYLISKYRENIDQKDLLMNEEAFAEWNLMSDIDKKRNPFSPKVTQKIILVDHIHIYQSKKQIDDILTIMNEFKMLDKNLSFIIYFQFNRTLEDVWRDTKDKKANPKNFLPNSSHIYNTDSLMQYADIILGMVIPQVVDMDEFASVYKERNLHLKEHFLDGSEDNVTVRLKGRNRIFYNYIKTRLTDDFEDPRLYCAVLDEKYEETANKIFKENKASISPLATIDAPVFNKVLFETNTDVTPVVSFETMGDAFDSPISKKDEPENDVPF